MALLMQNSLSSYKSPLSNGVSGLSSLGNPQLLPSQLNCSNQGQFGRKNVGFLKMKRNKVFMVLEMDKSAVISDPEGTENIIFSNNNEAPAMAPYVIEVDSVTEAEMKENGFRSTRRTKLVCTIGPASCGFEQLEALAMGGMNVARINMCHGTREWHRDVIRNVRRLNQDKGYAVAIMMDTQGSEIHMGDLGGAASIKAEVSIKPRTLNALFQCSVSFLRLESERTKFVVVRCFC